VVCPILADQGERRPGHRLARRTAKPGRPSTDRIVRPRPFDTIRVVAGSASQTPILELPPGSEEPRELLSELNGRDPAHKEAISEVQLTAARLYGQGFERRQIAKILMVHLASPIRTDGRTRTTKERLRRATRRLREWERKQEFRDLIWNHAVVQLDMSSPQILSGVSQKAKRGRVDAARLALEVTGRHNPKGLDKPTDINLTITNIPRPD
jgi:hypothetical protein